MANELQQESSPYLLQHANNPVHWKPWNEKTLEKAKQENKLMIVSIGYSACHWCHVMEHESFEDEEVATLMNENFLSVKVDREERPDVDQVYMDAAQIVTGRGGWPLNAICLPDGRPVYAGTYFPKQQWMQLLTRIATLWKDGKQTLINQAERIVQQAESFEITFENDEGLPEIPFDQLVEEWLNHVDWTHGGPLGAPKFPMPNNFDFLLQYGADKNSDAEPEEAAREFALFSLEKICKGGIYDHIGGGFARYSVDAQWHVPHFEKMLYDNAQLVSLLATAYKVSNNSFFKQTAIESIDFLLRDMRAKEGGFYSAYDADSEGKEGKFYVFDKQEVETVLETEKDVKVFCHYFDISESGNWEGTNVLRIVEEKKELAEQYGLSESELNQLVQSAKKALFQYREQRIKPGLDDKILTSWNALMVSALCDAYQAFGDEQYKQTAIETAEFILANQLKNNASLFRNYKSGHSTIHGFLDDYSFLTEALLSLYEISFDVNWLHTAEKLINTVTQQFYDEHSGLFFYTSSAGEKLILRKKETSDNVIPASNSSMFKAIYKYAKITGDREKEAFVTKTMRRMSSHMQRSPRYYSNWLQLALYIQEGVKEVAIVGEKADTVRKQLQTGFLPNTVFLGGTTDKGLEVLSGKQQAGKTMIYVCENHSCKQPVESVEEALELIIET